MMLSNMISITQASSLQSPASSLIPNLLTLTIFIATSLCRANQPTAETLLQEARLRPTTHPMTLAATIRGGEEALPLTFKIEKSHISYQLHDPDETILLTLEPTSSLVSDFKNGKSSVMSDERRYQDIRGTGVTYDDLSLGFLYWPHPRLAGKETLRGIKASIVELTPPAHHTSPYGSARLWIDQNSGAPLRMEGWNQQGQLVKRFEVISAQKIDGLWMLQEMRIETFDQATGKVIQRRYFTISRNAYKL
ncbi:MAG: outer membrane lipoprotein-sorting protein [Chthoniobacterales bacterium]